MIKDVLKYEIEEVINCVNKAEDIADRTLLESSEYNKHIERMSK